MCRQHLRIATKAFYFSDKEILSGIQSPAKYGKHRMRQIIHVCIALAITSTASAAVTTTDDRTELDLTLYQSGFAVIKDTRKIPVVEGVQDVQFESISPALISDSALLSGTGINVLERNYTYDLVSFQSLLEANIGKSVNLQLSGRYFGEGSDRMIWVQDATLLAVRDGFMIVKTRVLQDTLLKTEKERVLALPINRYSDMVSFNEVPETLSESPTLSMTLESDMGGSTPITLTYLSNGLDWEASYVANIKSDDQMSLNAWVTLTNDTDLPFDNANMQLMAGEVNRVSQGGGAPRRMEMMAMTDSAKRAPGASEQLGDYKLFKLPRKVDLAARQSKQVSLFRENSVSFEKGYEVPMRLTHGFEERKATVLMSLQNTEANGLGRALPAGIVRFYESDSEDKKQFVGEVRLPDLDKNQNFEAPIGKAFGLSVSNKVIAWNPQIGRIKGELVFANSQEHPAIVDLIIQSDQVRVNGSYTNVRWCEAEPFGNEKSLASAVNFNFNGTGIELQSIKSENASACRFTFRVPGDVRVNLPYQD